MSKVNDLIPIDEWMRRVKLILDAVPSLTSQISSVQTLEMFELYNDKMQPLETGTICGACRERVYNRIKEYYNGRI